MIEKEKIAHIVGVEVPCKFRVFRIYENYDLLLQFTAVGFKNDLKNIFVLDQFFDCLNFHRFIDGVKAFVFPRVICSSEHWALAAVCSPFPTH